MNIEIKNTEKLNRKVLLSLIEVSSALMIIDKGLEIVFKDKAFFSDESPVENKIVLTGRSGSWIYVLTLSNILKVELSSQNTLFVTMKGGE